MKYRQTLRLSALLLLFICLMTLDAWAGPHIKSMSFGKSILNSPWSKLLFFGIIAIGLPVLVFSRMRRYFKVRSTMAALEKIAKTDRNFDWQILKNHFMLVFTAMYPHFDQSEVHSVSAECTPGFQAEQAVLMQYWKEEGLVKRSSVQNIILMEPILLRHSGEPGGEDSTIVIDFKANEETYFTNAQTGAIEKGETGYREVETIWAFHLNKGKWLLHNIEPVELKSVYIDLTNEVPKEARG